MISENLKPRLLPTIYIHSADDRILYLNPTLPDWITVRSRYKPIFDMFDGTVSFSEIIDFIKSAYPDEPPALLIRQITNLLDKSSLFVHSSTIQKTHCQSNHLPKYVYLTLTDACNIECKYCYAKERETSAGSTLAQWMSYVDAILATTNPIVFTFTGGEPLLVPFVFDLAQYILEKKSQSILLTNGTLITSPEIADQITRVFAQVRVSIDSTDSNTNDYLRGPGNLRSTENAIRLLEEAGADYRAVAAVTRLNKDQLTTFVERFGDQASFQPLYKMGLGKDCVDLAITGYEYFHALSSQQIQRVLPGYKNNIHYYRHNPYKRCAMSIEELSIAPNGDLYPCHMLHYKELRIGNLNKTNFYELYRESHILHELRRINVETITQCVMCPVRNICGGGCRARLDYQKEGLIGHDSFCAFEKASILNALIYSYG